MRWDKPTARPARRVGRESFPARCQVALLHVVTWRDLPKSLTLGFRSLLGPRLAQPPGPQPDPGGTR